MIRERLLRAARRQFTRFGYRKASVSQIAREAGIGKGSLYLFFDSKANLFLAVAEKVEEELRSECTRALGEGPAQEPAEWIEAWLHFQVSAVEEDPFLAVVLDPEEAANLFRDLPPEVAQGHQERDDAYFRSLLDGWRKRGASVAVEPEVMASSLRGLLVILMNKEVVGREHASDVLQLLTRGLAQALCDA